MPPMVLYIDDRPELLELRKAVLEFSGYRVETVTSRYAAIKMLKATAVDVVLLEYTQQGLDAEAIASEIHRRFPDIPIVLLSAYFEMPERILWLVDAYVMKSELPEGLVRVIEKVTRPADTEDVRAGLGLGDAYSREEESDNIAQSARTLSLLGIALRAGTEDAL